MGKNIEPVSRSSDLIDLNNCFVMMIDVQAIFMQGLTSQEQSVFLQKFSHVIKLCQVLKIPLIITAEDVEKNGSVPSSLQNSIPDNIKVFDKFIYSCWGQKDIQEAIKNTNRQMAILCGFETDVCIAQTAIDLHANGFQVFILTDMTFSRNIMEHEIGLKRMEHHGIIFSLLKTWQEEISAGVRTHISQLLKVNKLHNI